MASLTIRPSATAQRMLGVKAPEDIHARIGALVDTLKASNPQGKVSKQAVELACVVCGLEAFESGSIEICS